MPGQPSAAAIERHPHLARPRPPGWVRVDLHCHTMWSGDSTTMPAELVEAVAATAIDVVCITDHQAIAGAEHLRGDLAEVGCRVVTGEELRTNLGELIGLFLRDRLPLGLSPRDAAVAIREQGGLVYVPHPFDPLRRNLAMPALDELVAAGLVDAVEVLNAKTSLHHLNETAARYADDHALAAGGGSDAHVPDAVGAAYVEMPDFDEHDPAAFLSALRDGAVVGHHYDAPRRWTPRVVPSMPPT